MAGPTPYSQPSDETGDVGFALAQSTTCTVKTMEAWPLPQK
jgi:hypothetical protein